MISKFLRRQWLEIRRKSAKRRALRIELLEDRRVMATAVWTNVLQPLNVSGHPSGIVSPLDVLYIINEINARRYSNPQTGLLPATPPPELEHNFPDVDCDQHVTPLDALVVINYLNGGPAGRTWSFQGSGESSPGSGNIEVYACRPVLVEGDAYRVGITSKKTLPNANSAIEVSFYAPEFDATTPNSVRDALEVAVLDASGQSVVLPIAPNQLAAFNWSEGLEPISAPAVQANIAPAGELSTVTINVVGVAANTPVEVLVRLVNNDSDNETRVRLHDIQVVPATGPNPQETIRTSNSRIASVRPAASQSLEELTGSIVPSFGATRLSDDGQVLISDLRITNSNDFAISGEVIIAIDALTDERIQFLNPDGYLADGRPFVRVDSLSGGHWLAPGESTTTRDIRFRNPLDQRFSFRLTALGNIHYGLGSFISTPTTEIEAGRTYRYSPELNNQSETQGIVFSKLVGPELLQVDSQTGQVTWTTTWEDIGNHTITIQATDRFGSRVEQTFTLDVRESLQNRPPVFVSTPGTEAVAAGAFDVITLPTGSMPAGLAVGNFGVLHGASSINELSLVAINQGSQTLSLIPGLGRDGAGREIYGPVQTLSVGEPPRQDELLRGVVDIDVGLPPLGNMSYDKNRIMGMIHGDFNGDGILDVATSIVYQYRSLAVVDHFERYIAITLGNGDGTFQPATHLAIPGLGTTGDSRVGAVSLHTYDFDGDGRLDLLTLDTRNEVLLFYRGLGDGTFEAARSQPIVTTLLSYKVYDLDGDGVMDLVAHHSNQSEFGWLRGRGDGTFEDYIPFTSHTGRTANDTYAVGDLNGDGIPDFVSGNNDTFRLNIYLGNGDGTFTRGVDLLQLHSGATFEFSTRWSISMAIADFNGDGFSDILFSTEYSSIGNGGGLTLYAGDGSGANFTRSAAHEDALPNWPVNSLGNAEPIDINGDGHLDLVFVASEFGRVGTVVITVAINRGNGVFDTDFWVDTNLGTHSKPNNIDNALGVLVGDFNNDGMVDLLTTRGGRQHLNNQFSSVSLMLADTPTTFRAARDNFKQYAQWGNASLVEYADFNNDGILDMWAPYFQNPSFTSLGNGDGTFQPAITATPNIGNEGLGKGFVADLDLDGNMDIVWFGGGGVQGGPQGRYLAALGNGDGTFQITFAQTGNNTPSGYAPIVIKPADFDGDGYMDFVAITGLNTIEIMRNVPDVPGTFARSYSVPFGSTSLSPSLAAGDFDGDGMPDVIAVRYQSSRVHDLLFYKGIGDGTLAEPVVFPFAPDTSGFYFPKHIAVGDLNGDGRLDFVINASYDRSAVVLGNGDGTFQPPLVYRTGTFFGDPGGLHLIDLDGDGHLDLVSMDDNHGTSRTTEVRLGIGDGTFGPAQIWGTTQGAGWLAFGDLDNDGRVDIGINSTDGSWSAVTTFLGARDGLSGVLTTDINGDGRTDILAINHDNSHVKRLINDGRGNFTRLHDLLVGAGPVELLSGDFNSNGRIDFLTINRSGRSISVMLADGLGGYARTDVPVGRLPIGGVFGKVTGGEHDDLLVIDAQLNALFVLKQDGTGAFTESALIPLGDKPSSIAVGDVDGDGEADVIISLAETNRLMILRSLGSGQFADPTYVNLPAKPGKIAAGDLNGDGLLDLAVTFPETGEVALLLGMGLSRFTQPQRIRVGSQPDSIVMADANGDGLLDILVTNAGDNTASVILNRFDPNQLYRYDALAIDPDDDPVTYSILEGPGGMILNAATGEIRWAPMGDQIGTQRVVLEVNDGRGGRATQEFSISVEAARTNAAHVITTLPAATVSAEHAFTTTVSATDPDGDRLRYRLVEGPEGASIDPVTGQIDWDPRGTAMQMNREVFAGGGILLPHTAAQNVDSLTVEGWFRFAKTSGNQVLIDKALNWATPGFFTLRYFTGNLQFLIGDGTAAGVETLSIARALPTEEWIHLSATFDDASGMMALFVNGVQVASRTTTKRTGVPGGNIPLWVGQEVYPFHGDVYGFRLWNTARPASQILDSMHKQLPAVTPNLVVDLRFSEGDSLSVINHPDPNHRGLISGTVVPKRIVGMAPLQTAQFTVSVEDGKGGFDLQTFSVTVAPKLPGTITGTLFSDDNRDGSRQAGEVRLAGWNVFIDQNNNGYRDADELFTITDASGIYQFNQLLQGDYTLAVQPQAGFITPAARGVSVVSQQVTTSDIATEPLLPGQVRGRLTQADPSQPLAHQQVFADLNGNGLWDDGEPTTTTDADGRYAIGGLPSGNYSLRVQTQPAWQVTQPAAAAHDVVLAGYDLLEDLDFVIQPSNSIAAASPQIVTVPPRSAAVGQPYRYAVTAISRDSRPIVYSLSLAPAGMVIDARTGQIAWTPTGKQTGSQQVVIRAATDNSHVDLQAFFIEVAPANTAPVVTSSPANPASADRLWSYPVMAQDAEQSELSYSLSLAPNGATIDAETGLIRWTPTAGQTGAHAFTVLVNDNAGGLTHHSFTLDVVSEAPSTLPFLIRSPRDNASLLTPYLSRVTGVDSSGQPLIVSLLSGPDGLTLDASGFIQWSPTAAQLGVQTLSVRFTSASGSTEERTYSVTVRQTIGNTAPQIQSTPSTLLAVAGQLYAYGVLVIDTDNDALSFELVAAPAGMSIHSQLGTLRWLPTLDQLGQSSVTIRVTDPQGGSESQSFTLTTRRVGGPPLIQSVPPTEAAVGIGYLYTVQAVDAENEPLTYSLIEAPVGMTINSRTGEIAWTPTAEQLGQQSVFIAVADASGNRSTQGFSVQVVAGLPNRPPVISSQPNLFATVGENYRTTIQAIDPEGTTVTYSLRRGPEGMTVDSATGQVNWTPTTGQAGRAIVTLVATDEQGGASVQSFEIDILGVNTSPEIISTPPTFAWARGLFQYDVIARDSDRDPIRYEFVSSVPNGMTIDPLGRIRWQTQSGDVGSYSVTVRASDPRGGEATQQIDFEVRADDLPPKVTVLPRAGGWPWDGPIVVFVSAVDNVGVVDVELRANGQIVPLDGNRTARLSFDDWGPGVLNMEAHAWDAAGNFGTGSAIAFYRDPEVDYESGEGLPIASIPTLGENGTVYGMVQIVGTAIGGTAGATGFKEYRLSYARLDQLQFTEFVHSTTPVTDGLLGVWDTTLLENDSYVLRLEVISEAGNTSVHETTVGVSGNLKLGNFRLSFEDLTIPVAGIPITIVRTYDTLRADRDGDFGFGWRLEYRNTDLRVSLPKSGLEDLGIYTAFRPGTKIYMTLPGGQRVGWTFTPEMRVLPGWAKGNDLVMASPRYTPDRGNTAILSAGSGWLTVNQFGELYATAGMPWNPASPDFGGGFTVTLADGTRYFIDGTTGLMQTATDRNGNTLTFSDSGITSLLGDVGITIARDRHGRITSITDPAGSAIRYGYSSSGDLIRVADREGHQTTMTYRTDRPHYLHSIVDPLGRTGIRNEYDANGRVVAVVNANGEALQVSYDPSSRVEVITDPLGHPTTYEYDQYGNVVTTVDALGAITRTEYDFYNFPIRSIDPLGRETRMVNDFRGNVVQETDPRGHTTHRTFSNFGDKTSESDPLGNVTRTEFDSRGNLTSRTDANGRTASIQYSNQGLIQSLVAIDGVRMSVTNDRGNPGMFTTEGRRPIKIDYDALGRPIGMTIYGNAANPLTENVVRFELDANGKTLRETDGEGGVTQYFYDEAGNQMRMVDPLGRVTRYEYDFANRLVKTIFPDETEEQQSFDAAGRRIATTDRLGRTTHYEFDAVGREITIIYPDGTPNDLSDNPRTRTEYDLAGQVTKWVNELGYATVYQYDAGGNQISMTNALNETWQMEYDANNRPIVVRDPLGNTMRTVYDGVGNVAQQTLPDGSRVLAEYDRHGRVTSRVDGEGARTSFRYDAYGALVEVVDPLGHRTIYERNERGQATAIIDAEGRRTEFQFDKANRQIARKLPDGAIEQFVYDAAGQMTSMIDFMGLMTTYAYDINGRLVRLEFADGRINETQYNAIGQVVSRREGEATTTYTFDERDRLTSKTDPDGLSIQYVYDVASNLLSSSSIAGTTVYSYDTVNRLQSITAGSDVTRYVYDAAGRKTEIQYANGTVERREYDPNSRVIRQLLTSPEGTLDDTRLTYDRVGRKTSLVESTGRKEFLEYDLAGRLIRNSVNEVSGMDRNTTWLYDAVGNRLRRDDSVTGVTTYEYDSRDRLLTETNAITTRYLYDANGNILSQFDGTKRIENTWDAANRLIESKVTEGATVKTVRYTYSPDGERYERIEDGETTRFLVDSNREHSVVIAELVNGVVSARYVRPPTGEAAIAMIRDGQTFTLYTTTMGTTKLVTDPSGIVTDRIVVDPFGGVIARTGVTIGLPIYNGEFRDALTGYDYLRSRFYSPQIGRFASMDSFAGWQDIPISFNKYLYAHSDPINGKDPSGFFNLTEQQANMAIVATTTLMGAVYGFNRAVRRGENVFMSTLWYGLVGFGVGYLAIVGGSVQAQIVTTVVRPFGATIYHISTQALGRIGITIAATETQFVTSQVFLYSVERGSLAAIGGVISILLDGLLTFGDDILNGRYSEAQRLTPR